jgi:hypothetical protein
MDAAIEVTAVILLMLYVVVQVDSSISYYLIEMGSHEWHHRERMAYEAYKHDYKKCHKRSPLIAPTTQVITSRAIM